ncbi:MAG: DUF393 domain-containing protein [Bacteroidia bacterium]|nr:DUF393 domain-containing protein [Bacteroidia bacterium]MDW8089337.1 DCC1-like thiol-disulfide oxidoreductase family protein [Bacteroidia bacterium]
MVGRMYYDGGCRLCRWLAQWGQKLLPQIEWVPVLYDGGAPTPPLPIQSIIYERQQRFWVRTEALRQALLDSGHWLLAWLLRIIPLSWRDGVYDWVAQRRCSQRCARLLL